MTTPSIAADTTTRADVAREILKRQRFVITSHARPDGDAIGSSMAMAYALRHLGKDVRVVSRDAVPPPLEGEHAVVANNIVRSADRRRCVWLIAARLCAGHPTRRVARVYATRSVAGDVHAVTRR